MAATDRDLYKQLCQLQELFSGRFTTEEIAVLLQKNDGQREQTVNYILQTEAKEIRAMLLQDQGSWTEIPSKAKRLRRQHAAQKSGGGQGGSILDRARSGRIDVSVRQFACGPCDSSWWRKVPSRKSVSKCHSCKTRYDPVPHKKEWGWAEFMCPRCNRAFGGWCAMDQASPCKQCTRMVKPTRILPPRRDQGIRRRSPTHHHCAGCDAAIRSIPAVHHYGPNLSREGATTVVHPVLLDSTFGTALGGGTSLRTNMDFLDGTCVHPQTRVRMGLPKVYWASRRHDSTGSTVDTFLTQGDLDTDQVVFFAVLPAVPEYGEDEDSSDGGPSENPGP